MALSFKLEPQDVPTVKTENRCIQTQIPVPEAVQIIKDMRQYEPLSMSGQPPVIWDRAVGAHVYDRWGNRWLDFSSGVVVANAGHSNPQVQEATMGIIQHGLMHSYCFPNEARSRLVQKISSLVPIPDNRVFLLTTGSESTECAIKLTRAYAIKHYGEKKIKIITFDDSFHGRTMGSQMAGGSEEGKSWIVNLDKDIQQVPFPNAFKYDWADEKHPDYSDEKCFDMFLKQLEAQGIDPQDIAGIMTETFQGGWVQLMPQGFVKLLREFCDQYDILLTFDEVQAGFARTGKMFGFMHYGVTPDLICCGKGITSGLPLSCVVGRSEIMDLFGPNKMTSTHSGNPVCSTAAIASINYIVDHQLAERAEALGAICEKRLMQLKEKYSRFIGFVSGYGLVWSVIFTKADSKDIDAGSAHEVVEKAMQKGLLFFAPVGAGSTIKVCPPLIIDETALNEGLDVFEECIEEVLGSHLQS